MSVPSIRAALEQAINGMSPALQTAWTNAPFTPTTGTPYQRVAMLLAEPAMLEMSNHWHREQGLLQINLCYPLSTGPAAAEARAELIRATFYAGAEFTSGGVVVRVEKTPEVAPGLIEDDRFVTPVRVRFYAHIRRA